MTNKMFVSLLMCFVILAFAHVNAAPNQVQMKSSSSPNIHLSHSHKPLTPTTRDAIQQLTFECPFRKAFIDSLRRPHQMQIPTHAQIPTPFTDAYGQFQKTSPQTSNSYETNSIEYPPSKLISQSTSNSVIDSPLASNFLNNNEASNFDQSNNPKQSQPKIKSSISDFYSKMYGAGFNYSPMKFGSYDDDSTLDSSNFFEHVHYDLPAQSTKDNNIKNAKDTSTPPPPPTPPPLPPTLFPKGGEKPKVSAKEIVSQMEKLNKPNALSLVAESNKHSYIDPSEWSFDEKVEFYEKRIEDMKLMNEMLSGL